MDSSHLNPDQFRSLLDGDAESITPDRIADHLDECPSCREALDQMAAGAEFWEKAARMISGESLSDSFVVGGEDYDEVRDSVENPDEKFRGAAKGVAHETVDELLDSVSVTPVTQLLDPPRHPEMLGRIGAYDVEREVGRGGMGVVFKAHDAELNRPVAVKVLMPHLAASGAARKRFLREARAAAAILHPNVVSIHGIDASGKVPFIVMPFVSGPSLRELVDRTGPLEVKDIVRIAMQIAAGLTAAHSQGVVHRDIKPGNILIESGVSRVLITDFGLARAANEARMTRTGCLAGTPNFMSPEQAQGEPVDHRSDLFSLGSVIYFMATGRMPFRAESPVAVLHRICHDQPSPVREVNPDISLPLAHVIGRLHEKQPELRFETAAQLHQLLESYLAHLQQPSLPCPDELLVPLAESVVNNDADKPIVSKPFPGFSRLTILMGLVIVAAIFVPMFFWPQNPLAQTETSDIREPVDYEMQDRNELAVDSIVDEEFSDLQNQKKEIESELSALRDRFIEEEIDQQEYVQQRKALEEKKNRINAELIGAIRQDRASSSERRANSDISESERLSRQSVAGDSTVSQPGTIKLRLVEPETSGAIEILTKEAAATPLQFREQGYVHRFEAGESRDASIQLVAGEYFYFFYAGDDNGYSTGPITVQEGQQVEVEVVRTANFDADVPLEMPAESGELCPLDPDHWTRQKLKGDEFDKAIAEINDYAGELVLRTRILRKRYRNELLSKEGYKDQLVKLMAAQRKIDSLRMRLMQEQHAATFGVSRLFPQMFDPEKMKLQDRLTELRGKIFILQTLHREDLIEDEEFVRQLAKLEMMEEALSAKHIESIENHRERGNVRSHAVLVSDEADLKGSITITSPNSRFSMSVTPAGIGKLNSKVPIPAGEYDWLFVARDGKRFGSGSFTVVEEQDVEVKIAADETVDRSQEIPVDPDK